MTGKLMTVAEVAARLRRGRSGFYKLVKKVREQGRPFPAPMNSDGTRPLYDSELVERWIAAQFPETAA